MLSVMDWPRAALFFSDETTLMLHLHARFADVREVWKISGSHIKRERGALLQHLTFFTAEVANSQRPLNE